MTRLLLPAMALGILIAYVDSRPNWDDTGVTAASVFAACVVWGVLSPARPWLWALAIGAWIPAVGVATARNYGSLLALVVAFVGAYGGAGLRKLFRPV